MSHNESWQLVLQTNYTLEQIKKGGAMKIIKKVNSYNYNGTDCFGITGIFTTDHIYPLSLGGSDIKENLQTLSQLANQIKKNWTKGKIGNWKFAIIKKTTKDGQIYGQMIIRNKDWGFDEWAEVIPKTIGNSSIRTERRK